MDINNNDHVINKILNMSDLNAISINVYLVKRDSRKESFYFSKSVELDKPLRDFLKEHIIKELRKMRTNNGSIEHFNISPYNNEFSLTDVLGTYNIKNTISQIDEEKNKDKVVERIALLKAALIEDSLEKIKNANFQIVSLEYNKEKINFCFYRSIKKIAKAKRWAVFSSNELKEVADDLLELGGSFSFFYDEETIYINKVRDFENAFDYKDHISIKSTENLEKITNMDFFRNEKAKNDFITRSKNQLFSRGLAQITDDTMRDLKNYYEERVKELGQINNKLNSIKDEEKRKKFEEEIGDLKDLILFFDYKTKKIKFTDADNPKPLLHFFQDKIVSSFLTKKVRTVMGY